MMTVEAIIGILICGSGNITHEDRAARWQFNRIKTRLYYCTVNGSDEELVRLHFKQYARRRYYCLKLEVTILCIFHPHPR